MHDRMANIIQPIVRGIPEGLTFEWTKFLLAFLKGSFTIARMKTLLVCT
jgi:hypothetical protein